MTIDLDETVRRDEGQKRPQLQQVVLNGRAGEQNATVDLQVAKRARKLGLAVLEPVRLVDDELAPREASELVHIVHESLVSGQTDVELGAEK